MIEKLCVDLKHAVHARWAENISELGYMMKNDDIHHAVGQSLITQGRISFIITHTKVV